MWYNKFAFTGDRRYHLVKLNEIVDIVSRVATWNRINVLNESSIERFYMLFENQARKGTVWVEVIYNMHVNRRVTCREKNRMSGEEIKSWNCSHLLSIRILRATLLLSQPALCWLTTHFSHSHFVATSKTEIKHTADSAHMWDGARES